MVKSAMLGRVLLEDSEDAEVAGEGGDAAGGLS